MVFPVVRYGLRVGLGKSWVPKIDPFVLWCWRRLLRVSWTARWSNQSILKDISPECSLERLMLKLKLQYFGHLMRRADSFIGKDPDAGKYWGQEEKGTTEEDMVRWHHQLSGRGLRWTPRVGDGQGGLVCCNSWCHKESDTTNKLNRLPLSFSVKTSPSVFPFVSSSLHLSTSIIYDGLDGVILWGSITVESVP